MVWFVSGLRIQIRVCTHIISRTARDESQRFMNTQFFHNTALSITHRIIEENQLNVPSADCMRKICAQLPNLSLDAYDGK